MSRYIEANDLVRKMTLQANRSSLGEIAPPQLSYGEMLEIIADAPTADVVPKSEYDAAMIDRNAARLGMIAEHERLKTAKADVAREIFEEIEHIARAAIILLKFEKDEKIRNAKTECYTDLIGYIAELKKKYVEGGG